MVGQIDEKITVSKALEQNKYIWAKAMFKTKPLQALMGNFSNQVFMLMKKELEKNEQKIDQFMKLTRAPDQSLRSAKTFLAQVCGDHHDHTHESKEKTPAKPRDNTAADKTPTGLPKEAGDLHADPDGPINFHGLAKLVKNAKTLFLIVEHYLVPENLDPNLQLTTQWLQSLCNTRELVTFSHKIKALEEIHKIIHEEIDRKKVLSQLSTNLTNINCHVSNLDRQCDVFSSQDENQERQKRDRIIQKFKFLRQVDPYAAERLVGPRAHEYMCEWGDEPVTDHKFTIKGWKEIWKTNQEFENEIMDEMRWYKLDMVQFKRIARINLDNTKEKSYVYIASLEMALNELKMQKQLENERLNMELEDVNSDALRKKVDDDTQANNFIEKFLEDRPKFTTIRDYNRYLDQLREAVRVQHHSLKSTKIKLEQMKADNQTVEYRIANLQDENEAKSKYFQWINEAAMAGSGTSLPRAYLTGDSKKRTEVFAQEGLHFKHLQTLENANFKEKLIEDIEMSKVFSILASKVHDMAANIGLLSTNLEALKKGGAAKYQFRTDHLLDLYNILRTPVLEKNIALLGRYSKEMQKFKKQYASEETEQPDPKDLSKKQPETQVSEASLIESRYKRLSRADKVILKSEGAKIINQLDLDADTQKSLIEHDNALTLATSLNAAIMKDSKSEKQKPHEQTVRIHDILFFENDRFQIDDRGLCVYISEIPGRTKMERNDDEIGNKCIEIGKFLQSVISVNRLISGKLTKSQTYLSEVNQSKMRDKEVQVKKSQLKKSHSEIKNEEYIDNLKNKLKQVEAVASDMEKQLQEAGLAVAAAASGKLASRKQTQALSESGEQASQEDGENKNLSTKSFFQDIAKISEAVAKTLDLDKDDPQNIEIITEIQDDIQNKDLFQSNLKSINFEELLTEKKNAPKQKLPMFEENTIGDAILDMIYTQFELNGIDCNQIQMARKKNKQLSDPLHTQTQTEIDQEQMVELAQLKEESLNKIASMADNLKGLDIDRAATAKTRNTIDDLVLDRGNTDQDSQPLTQIHLNNRKNSLLLGQLDGKASSLHDGRQGSALHGFESQKSVVKLNRRDSKLMTPDDTNKKGSEANENIKTQDGPDDFEGDLHLHEVYDEMNMDDLLKEQGFVMFPPQKQLKIDLYNQMNYKLDYIDKNTSDTQQVKDKNIAATEGCKTPQMTQLRQIGQRLVDFKDLEKYYKLERGSLTKTLLGNRKQFQTIGQSEAVAQTCRARSQSNICVNRAKYRKRKVELYKMKERQIHDLKPNHHKLQIDLRPRSRESSKATVKRNQNPRTQITINMNNKSKFTELIGRGSIESQKSQRSDILRNLQNIDMDETLQEIPLSNDHRAHTQVFAQQSPFDLIKQDTFEQLDQKDRDRTHSTIGQTVPISFTRNPDVSEITSKDDMAVSGNTMAIVSVTSQEKGKQSRINTIQNSQGSKKSLASPQSSAANVKIVIRKQQDQNTPEKIERLLIDDPNTTLQKSKEEPEITEVFSHEHIAENDGFIKINLNKPTSQKTVDTNFTKHTPFTRVVSSPLAVQEQRKPYWQGSISPDRRESEGVSSGLGSKIITKGIMPNDQGIRKVRQMIQSAHHANQRIPARQYAAKLNMQTDASQQTGLNIFQNQDDTKNDMIGSSFLRQKYYQMQVKKLNMVSSHQSSSGTSRYGNQSQIRKLSGSTIARINKKAQYQSKGQNQQYSEASEADASPLTSQQSQSQYNNRKIHVPDKRRAVSTRGTRFGPHRNPEIIHVNVEGPMQKIMYYHQDQL